MMKDAQPREVRLADYQPPTFLIDCTRLHFELGEAATLVKSNLQIRRNPECTLEHPALVLDGIDLELKRIAIEGRTLDPEEYSADEESLTILNPPTNFELECVTLIRPQLNKSLEGLYRSNNLFCTQCEAEGFRKITYYLDRPDIMSVFTTTVVASASDFPILLSNGNDIDRGELEDGRHWVTWHDPFKKPAYLFALVAGSLSCHESMFTTQSGREVILQIFVEPENIDKVCYAMNCLKRAMSWDEEVYGREYDLDKFMIVAVSDFNMGAMENKGLNIFNTSCVLANSETQTDAAFLRVEAVIAHEYFHNWSGNRVTCRDWFQLSLKEGLTVFRDQQFSADMNSPTVKRIDDVTMLRTLQFAEDAGPMAHPVRPDSYMEISNFYTVTIYEKGAELIRMLHTLLGETLYRQGTDLYFERHDGQAVTTEDFVKAMEDAAEIDLTQFRRWYEQAGTPTVKVTDQYDAEQRTYSLTFEQTTPSTPGQTDKQPLHIPVNLGLLSAAGQELKTDHLELTEASKTYVFAGIEEKPIPSLLRGLSAPVKVEYDYKDDELITLMRHDTDGFNRWDAAQILASRLIMQNIQAHQRGESMNVDAGFADVYRELLAKEDIDEAMLSRMLLLPSEEYLAEQVSEIDPEAIHAARQHVREYIAEQLQDELWASYEANKIDGAYSAHAEAMALRSLKNTALSYLMTAGHPQALSACVAQFENSDNMTDVSAALIALANSKHETEKHQALESFYQRWQQDPLVVDQWLSIQATSHLPDTFERVKMLCQHPVFNLENPNKVRALIGAFCMRNRSNFHRKDGLAYAFLADQVLTLDAKNPQIAARLLQPMIHWRRYTPELQTLMHEQLERIHNQTTLSKDLYEVVAKSLA